MAAFTWLASAALVAQAPGARGQMMGGGMYDKAAEVTVTATVKEVVAVPPRGAMAPGGGMAGGMMGGMMGGTHLVASVGDATMEVDLGPQSFLDQEHYAFAAGDQIAVTGAKTKRGETEAIIARIIKKGDVTMTFRDENGRPLWAGRGRTGAQ